MIYNILYCVQLPIIFYTIMFIYNKIYAIAIIMYKVLNTLKLLHCNMCSLFFLPV